MLRFQDLYLPFLHYLQAAGKFEINGVSFVPPTVPVLLQIISGTTAAGSYDSICL